MRSSPSHALPTLAVCLGVSLAIAACPAPAAAESRTLLGGPTAPAAGAPTRPVLRLKPVTPSLDLTLRQPSPGRPGGEDARLPESRRDRMSRAFQAEMREEAIRSRRASLYATIPTELPELLEDDYIRKQQARVAESVLFDAVEAALSEGFFDGRFHESKLTVRPLVGVAEHGIRVDASPSWTYKVRSARGGFSVDVPLTPSSIRLHAYRDLKGTDHTPLRLGAGLLVDPFDEEVRAGVSFQF